MSKLEIATLFIGLSGHNHPTTDGAQEKVLEMLSERFPSFTITEGAGYFRGNKEKTLLVHIATEQPQEVVAAASLIREVLHQEGVGIGFRGRYFRATESDMPKLDS